MCYGSVEIGRFGIIRCVQMLHFGALVSINASDVEVVSQFQDYERDKKTDLNLKRCFDQKLGPYLSI